MRIFSFDDVYNVVCDNKDTRNGFKHVAKIFKNGIEQDNTKICYLNRTWESFEYESILQKIVNQYFEESEKQKYIDVIKTFR